jgi:hypothetical protein
VHFDWQVPRSFRHLVKQSVFFLLQLFAHDAYAASHESPQEPAWAAGS